MYKNNIEKVLGPYTRKDGRKQISFKYKESLKWKTMSYPKFLMEQYLGKSLSENETIDHIDRNFSNNEISNLRIIDRKKHTQEDVIRVKPDFVLCIWCKASFLPTRNQWANRKNRKSSGPFCSRKCSGTYGSAIRQKKIEKMERQKINLTYYQNKKDIQ